MSSLVAQTVQNLPATQETRVVVVAGASAVESLVAEYGL